MSFVPFVFIALLALVSFVMTFLGIRTNDKFWMPVLLANNWILAFAGMIIVANSNDGDLPADVMIANLLIFCAPLLAWGLGRFSHRAIKNRIRSN